MGAPATDLALDFSNEAMTPPALSDAYRALPPRDQWLERRTHAFGGSEVGALLVSYGLAPHAAVIPAWVLDQTTHYDRLGIPRLLAWKSGLRSEPKGDLISMARGSQRERELLARFKATIAKRRVDPKTIRHADTLPKQFYPFVDRRCHRLAVTPDAWARAHDGELVMIELKTSRKALTIVRAPWHYRCQIQAEMAACGAAYGLLVIGERWADPTENVPDGPVRAFAEKRDAQLIDLIRTVATEAWGVVEQLRNLALEVDALGDARTRAAQAARKAAAHRCAELWRESQARMQAFRPAGVQRIEAALTALGGIDGFAA